MKMKQIMLIAILVLIVLVAGCSQLQATPEAGKPVQANAAEQFADASPEQVQQELDTKFLDDLEKDSDSLIIK